MLLFILIGEVSCKKSVPLVVTSTPSPVIDFRDTLANYARSSYYWDSLIPTSFNPHSYSALDTFFAETNAIRGFSGKDPNTGGNLDRFSFVLTEKEYQTLFINGSSLGYGLEFRFDENGSYRIRYAAHASQAYKLGVRRGWKLDSVNGMVPSNTTLFFNQLGTALNSSTLKMDFEDANKISHSLNLSSASVLDDEVVTTSVKDTAGKKIGYMVYNTFLPKASGSSIHPGLDTAFAGLAKKGITDLVIDLRYNGGGYVEIVQEMANALIPSAYQGKVLFTEVFNKNLKSDNSTTLVNKNLSANPPLLNINSINFIVSEGTASASELIINSLFPYFPNIQLIGVSLGRGAFKQNTAGKPFGFFNYSFPFVTPKFEAFLINDETKNALGKDNYTAGFVPNIQVYDGVEYDWGNPVEYGYAEAVHYVVSGSLALNKPGIKSGNGLSVDKKSSSFPINLASDRSPVLIRPIGQFHLKGNTIIRSKLRK